MYYYNFTEISILIRFKLRTSTVSSSEIQSPEADTSVPTPPPITIHLYKSCSGGPYINTTLLATSVEDTSPVVVTKKLIMELLNACSKPETLLARLSALRGEEMVISYGGTTYTIKLPQILKSGDLERVFSALATIVGCCHLLFSEYCIIFIYLFIFATNIILTKKEC